MQALGSDLTPQFNFPFQMNERNMFAAYSEPVGGVPAPEVAT